MPRIELTALPLVYKARYHRQGRRKPELAMVQESMVFDLPSWREEDAPLVATAHRANIAQPGPDLHRFADATVHLEQNPQQAFSNRDRLQDLRALVNRLVQFPAPDYRVARGMDGLVRLVAKADGPAFLSCPSLEAGTRILAHLAELPDGYNRLARCQAFGGHVEGAEEYVRRDQLETVSTSERGQALARLRSQAQKAVLIDGEVWLPAEIPVWNLSANSAYLLLPPQPGEAAEAERRERLGLTILLGALGAPAVTYDHRTIHPVHKVSIEVARTANEATALVARKEDPFKLANRQELWVPPLGPVFEPVSPGVLHPEAFRSDYGWSHLCRCLARDIVSADEFKASRMTDSEVASYARLRLAARDWPEVRDRQLIQDLISLTAALHSVGYAKSYAFRERIQEAVEWCRTHRPPAPLEQRLGMELPPLPVLRPQPHLEDEEVPAFRM